MITGGLRLIAFVSLTAALTHVSSVLAQSFDTECGPDVLKTVAFNVFIPRCEKYARSLSNLRDRADAFSEVVKARAIAEVYPDYLTFQGAEPDGIRLILPFLVAQTENAGSLLDPGNTLLTGVATLDVFSAGVALIEGNADLDQDTYSAISRVPIVRLVRALVANMNFPPEGVAVGVRLADRVLNRLQQPKQTLELVEYAITQRPELGALLIDERVRLLTSVDRYAAAYEAMRLAAVRDSSLYANVARLAELAGYLVDAEAGYTEALKYENSAVKKAAIFLRLAMTAKADGNQARAAGFLTDASEALNTVALDPAQRGEAQALRVQLDALGRLLR